MTLPIPVCFRLPREDNPWAPLCGATALPPFTTTRHELVTCEWCNNDLRAVTHATLRALLAERAPCTYAVLEGPGRCDLPDPIAAGLELEAMREAGEVAWEGSPAVYRLVEAAEPDFWAIVRSIRDSRGGALPAQDETQAQMERWRVLARPLLAHLGGESRVARAIALANAAGLYDAADALRYRGVAELDALAAHEARAPRPPAELVDALQDRIHEDVGIARPARGVKVPRGG